MKFTIAIFAFFAVFAVIQADPINVSGNNVGDIVTVGVNAKASLSNNIEANFAAILLALLNQQGIVVAPQTEQVAPAEQPQPNLSSMITPEMLNKVKDIKITPEMIDGLKRLLNQNEQ